MCYTGSDMDLTGYSVEGLFPAIWKVDLDADNGVVYMRSAVLQLVLWVQL